MQELHKFQGTNAEFQLILSAYTQNSLSFSCDTESNSVPCDLEGFVTVNPHYMNHYNPIPSPHSKLFRKHRYLELYMFTLH